MNKVTELDGVVKKASWLKKEEIVCQVLLLSLTESYDFGDIGQDDASHGDGPSINGCHRRHSINIVQQTDFHGRKDVIRARHTPNKPG